MVAKKAAAARAAAKPAATPARPPVPVVKTAAKPVTPTVKAGAQRVTPTPKVADAKPVVDGVRRPATKATVQAAGPAKATRATPKATPKATAKGAASGRARTEAAPPVRPAPPRGAPRFDPPRFDPPEPAPRREPPRDAPRFEWPRFDPPRFDSPPVGPPGGPPAESPAAPPEAPARPQFGTPPADGPPVDGPPVEVDDDPPPAGRPAWRRARPVATTASADVIGEALERGADEPVEYEPEPEVLPAAVEVRYDDTGRDDEPRGRPLVRRVVRADWLPTLAATLPALVATFLVVLVATLSLTLLTSDGEAFIGETPAGRWLRVACAAVGLTFGGKLAVHRAQQEFLMDFTVQWAPLTLTAASLVALWFFTRRAHQRNLMPDRLPDAIRAALVFAAGVGLLARLGRWQVETVALDGLLSPYPIEIPETSFSTSVWQPMFWAFCAAFAVVWLATGRLVVTGLLATRLLAARGALAGLAAGSAASLVVLLVAGWVRDTESFGSTDVTNALPVALAYAPGLGAAAFGVTSGGWFVWPFGTRGYLSIWGPSLPWSVLALVIPVLAVVGAVVYLQRQRGVPPGELLRACRWMGVPAGLGWLVLGVLGAARWEQTGSWEYFGRTTAGGVLWNALVVGLWFAAGGRAAAWYLVRQERLAAEREAQRLRDEEPVREVVIG